MSEENLKPNKYLDCPYRHHVDEYWELDGTYFPERLECHYEEEGCFLEVENNE